MTIIEAISQIDSLKPNTYSAKQKIQWLSQLEALVKKQVFDSHQGGEALAFEPFTEDTDTDTELFMPAPYDAAYLYWLEAQIHYANEDIGLYNSAITLFTAAYSAFQADYHRNHEARITGRFRF